MPLVEAEASETRRAVKAEESALVEEVKRAQADTVALAVMAAVTAVMMAVGGRGRTGR